jgi:hypothetical protein
MTDLSKLSPAALSAAMRGGTADWGIVASSKDHVRYLGTVSGRSRRRCHCGCGTRATHLGMANGIALMSGCEMRVRRWVKEQEAKQ